MELLSGHEKIITKSGISLNAGTLNWGFTVLALSTIFRHFNAVQTPRLAQFQVTQFHTYKILKKVTQLKKITFLNAHRIFPHANKSTIRRR
jgi:hypothetical protein